MVSGFIKKLTHQLILKNYVPCDTSHLNAKLSKKSYDWLVFLCNFSCKSNLFYPILSAVTPRDRCMKKFIKLVMYHVISTVRIVTSDAGYRQIYDYIFQNSLQLLFRAETSAKQIAFISSIVRQTSSGETFISVKETREDEFNGEMF